MWLIYIKDGGYLYYTGKGLDGRARWHSDPNRAVLVEDRDGLIICDQYDANRTWVSPNFCCANCGSTHTCISPHGDLLCAGCGHGARGLICCPREPISVCSCGTAIYDYNADLFRGPVCPRCNRWC